MLEGFGTEFDTRPSVTVFLESIQRIRLTPATYGKLLESAASN